MKHPFEAVAVRYVHDVLTGEFLNVGVVLLCQPTRFAGARFLSTWSRVTRTFPGADVAHLSRLAQAITAACDELYAQGAEMAPQDEPRDLLGFLTRVITPDDSSLQLSGVIRGITDEPTRKLVELTARYAERYLPETSEQPAETNVDARASVARALAEMEALQGALLSPMLSGETYARAFDLEWSTSVVSVASWDPPSFLDPLLGRASTVAWSGPVREFRASRRSVETLLFHGMTPPSTFRGASCVLAGHVKGVFSSVAGEREVAAPDPADEGMERSSRRPFL